MRSRRGSREIPALLFAAVIGGSCLVSRAHAQCDGIATVGARSVAANVSTESSAWMNALLSGLVGAAVDLDVADAQALADATITVGALRDVLGEGGALGEPMTLAALVAALGEASGAGGDEDAAQVLLGLSTGLAGLTGDVRITDVLDVADGADDAILLPLQELLVDVFAAYQIESIDAPAAVVLDAALLGSLDVLDTVSVEVLVVENGLVVVGGEGTTARSPHLRVRLMITPVEADVNVAGLGGLATVTLALEPLTLVLDLAPGTMTITSVSDLGVDVSATPGVVTAHLGVVSDEVFADRTSSIDPETDVGMVGLAELEIALLSPVLVGSASVRARASASATSTPSTLHFDGPYPETLTATTGLTFLDTLVSDLLEDLEVEVTAYTAALGLTLVQQALVEDAVTDLLEATTSPLVAVVDQLAEEVVDPLFESLGVSVGALDVAVFGVSNATEGVACTMDGMAGTCRQSSCCTGCWNGGACVAGTEVSSCGGGGAMCASCDDGVTCSMDACEANVCTHTPTSPSCPTGPPDPDTDTDGDGTPDVDEDRNGNGDLDDDDTDGDGIPDYLDPIDDPLQGGDDVGVRGGALCAAHMDAPTDGAPSALLLIIAVGLVVGLRRGNRRSIVAATAAATVSSALGSTTRAQPMANVQRFSLPETPSGGLALSDTRTLGHLRPAFVLSLDYANDPLVLERTDANGDREVVGRIIEHQLYVQGVFALGLGARGLVFVRLPVAPVLRGDETLALLPPGTATAGDAGLGDLAVGGRVRLVGEDDAPLTVGVQVTLTLPTATGSTYVGERTVTTEPEVLLRARVGIVTLRGNLGVRIRKPTDIANLDLGSELTFAGGVALLVFDGRRDLSLHAEIFGGASFQDFGERGTVPVELIVGASAVGEKGVSGTVGVGPGISRGYGTPDVRALASIGYARPSAVAPVAVETCAAGAEDFDGFEDEDGCLDADDDHDAILDAVDACPRDAEDVDGFEDADGCPDADNDADRVLDAADACANEVEDVDGWQDEDGCPDPDNDGDGILDPQDQCPVVAEDRDGIRDEDGCPETDADGDGMLDEVDRCPLDAESRNGVDDEDGCPDHVRVDLSQGRIAIMEPVFFAVGSDRILSQSFEMLDEIAGLLQHREELGRIAIEGHTDDRGRDDRNLELSQRRAEAVRRYLVQRGVPEARLEAHGYGETRPLAGNRSARDRARNRRVEFNILGTAGTQTVVDDGGGDTR